MSLCQFVHSPICKIIWKLKQKVCTLNKIFTANRSILGQRDFAQQVPVVPVVPVVPAIPVVSVVLLIPVVPMVPVVPVVPGQIGR